MRYGYEDVCRHKMLMEGAKRFRENLFKIVLLQHMAYMETEQYARCCLLGTDSDTVTIEMPDELVTLGIKDMDVMKIALFDTVGRYVVYMEPAVLYQDREVLYRVVYDCLNSFDEDKLNDLNSRDLSLLGVEFKIEDEVDVSKVQFETWKYFECVNFWYDDTKNDHMQSDEYSDYLLFTPGEQHLISYRFDFFSGDILNKPLVHYISGADSSYWPYYSYSYSYSQMIHFDCEYGDKERCYMTTYSFLNHMAFRCSDKRERLLLFLTYKYNYDVNSSIQLVHLIKRLQSYGAEVVTTYTDFNEKAVNYLGAWGA